MLVLHMGTSDSMREEIVWSVMGNASDVNAVKKPSELVVRELGELMEYNQSFSHSWQKENLM